MGIIYKPKGKALEYAELAANLYRGCSHCCEYCFAPSTTRKDKNLFHSKGFIQPRKDVLKNLIQEVSKFYGCPHNVLMSFTTDPYQPIEDKERLTRNAIDLLYRNNIGVTILTKGGLLATRDFDILKLDKRSEFGVTLTCADEKESLKWEPGASLPIDRINSLHCAHRQGIKTYVSFEPVLDPESVYELITKTYGFVDFYKVGKLNYRPHSKTINWPYFRENVIKELKRYNKKFLIKNDLMMA